MADRFASGVVGNPGVIVDEARAYSMTESAAPVALRSFPCAAAWQTWIAVVSFSPTVRNRISSLPASESKNQRPSFETSGMGKGQFSAPIYSTVLPSGSRTRRCISRYFSAKPLAFEFVLDFVARRSHMFAGSEDPFQSFLVIILGGLKQSAGCFPRRRKGLWS